MFPSASIFLCSRLGEALELVRPYPNQLQRIVYWQVEDPADCRRPGPDPALTSQAQRRRRRNARTASSTQPTSTVVTKTTQIGSSGGIARPLGQVAVARSDLATAVRRCLREAPMLPSRFAPDDPRSCLGGSPGAARPWSDQARLSSRPNHWSSTLVDSASGPAR